MNRTANFRVSPWFYSFNFTFCTNQICEIAKLLRYIDWLFSIVLFSRLRPSTFQGWFLLIWPPTRLPDYHITRFLFTLLFCCILLFPLLHVNFSCFCIAAIWTNDLYYYKIMRISKPTILRPTCSVIAFLIGYSFSFYCSAGHTRVEPVVVHRSRQWKFDYSFSIRNE